VTFPHIEPPDLPGRQRQQIHRIRDLDPEGYDGEVGGRILSQNLRQSGLASSLEIVYPLAQLLLGKLKKRPGFSELLFEEGAVLDVMNFNVHR